MHRSQTIATRESTVPNLRHRRRYRDAREVGAMRESPVPDLSHGWGDGDACEVLATSESPPPNLLHRFWNRDARELFAVLERLLFYLCLPFGYDGLAILDVVAVFFVFCHSRGFGWFIQGKDTNK